MEQRKEFLLDTNGFCFLCLKHECRNLPKVPKSLQNIFRYLKINLGEVFGETIQILPSTLPALQGCSIRGTLCEDCDHLHEKFSKYFEELEVIRMKLEWSLKEMSDRTELLDVDGGNGQLKEFQTNMSRKPETLLHHGIVEELRKQTREQCGKLKGNLFPLVYLKRIGGDRNLAGSHSGSGTEVAGENRSSEVAVPRTDDNVQRTKQHRLDLPVAQGINVDVKIEQDSDSSAYNEDGEASQPLIDIGEVKVERHFANVLLSDIHINGNISTPASTDKLHPLQNPKLLASLFGVCPPALLATCRLVCRAWLDASIPIWRSTFILVSYYVEDPVESPDESEGKFLCFGDHWSGGSETSLQEFIDFWGKECRAFPYRCLRLYEWEFWLMKHACSHCHHEDQAKQFLQMVGSSITKLHLYRCNFSTVQEFLRLISETFPNLESLIMQGTSIVSANNHELPKDLEVRAGENLHLTKLNVIGQCQVEWTDLLPQFPLLTSLEKSYHTNRYRYRRDGRITVRIEQEDVQRMLVAIKTIRENSPDKLPLTNFCIKCTLELSMKEESRDMFNLIRQLSLHLSSVKIKLDCDPNVVDHMVAWHRKSLTQITVVKDKAEDCDKPPTPATFLYRVALENLRELAICDQACKSMTFLKHIPNLEILRVFDNLKDYYWSDKLETRIVANTAQAEMAGVKLPKVKQLYIGYKVSEEDLQRLTSWLPNVEVLSAFLNDEQFAVVCENWRNLKHLHVLGGELTDKGVTGRVITTVAPGPTGRGRKRKQVDIQAEEIQPNITLLQGLRCFKIEDELSSLSDISAFEGFLKLPNLQNLDIYSYTNRFGKQATDTLEQIIKRCTTCGPFYSIRPHHHKGDLFRDRSCEYLE